jgi:hypothetical protein
VRRISAAPEIFPTSDVAAAAARQPLLRPQGQLKRARGGLRRNRRMSDLPIIAQAHVQA